MRRNEQDEVWRRVLTQSPTSASKRLPPPLYIWEPIPPAAEYVAIGMVATDTDEAPHLDEVRRAP